MERCSFSLETGDCHKQSYVRKKDPVLTPVIDLSDRSQRLLKARFQVEPSRELINICLHHEKVYIDRYEDVKANRQCVDPFKKHRSPGHFLFCEDLMEAQ